ncbi:hypothetical protein Dimus_009095 [Dionaea muscipula]
MASGLDMSLDDLIKTNKTSVPRGGFRARGGGRGGGVGVGGGGRSGPGAARRFPNRPANRPAPYSFPKAPESIWPHDFIADQAAVAAAAAAASAAASSIETGTKLYISNLDYGVSNEDVRECPQALRVCPAILARTSELERWRVRRVLAKVERSLGEDNVLTGVAQSCLPRRGLALGQPPGADLIPVFEEEAPMVGRSSDSSDFFGHLSNLVCESTGMKSSLPSIDRCEDGMVVIDEVWDGIVRMISSISEEMEEVMIGDLAGEQMGCSAPGVKGGSAICGVMGSETDVGGPSLGLKFGGRGAGSFGVDSGLGGGGQLRHEERQVGDDGGWPVVGAAGSKGQAVVLPEDGG